MLLALVFGAIFFIVFSGLSGFVISENNFETFHRAQSEATSIAEAGLEYYRWHLAHFPNDLQNGTGQPGPYTISYNDPQGGTVGTYTLNIKGNQSCGQTTSIDITSTGRPADDPSVSQTLIARYARPTVARYDFISNAGVWIGVNDSIHGSYHSNSGIRMNGTSNAPVTSSLASWVCTWSFGCSGNQTKPGVFGTGTNQNLWKFPTPQVDFNAIAADFFSLKTTAQANGIYLPRYSAGNKKSVAYHKGYLLIFNANDTVTIYRVKPKKLRGVQLLDSNKGSLDFSLIKNKTFYETLPIPSSCGLIFVEDNTWIEGIIPTQVTLVVANVSNTGVNPDAFLKGNITYASNNGTDGFTLIAAHSVLITADSPYNMTLYGVYIAQSGAWGRNGYYKAAYSLRGTLTTIGSAVSALQAATTYVGNGGKIVSGYKSTVDYPDQRLATNPPPFTPVLSPEYQFVSWRQK